MKVDTSGLGADPDRGAEAFRAATANLNVAEGRFLDGETAGVLAVADNEVEVFRAAKTKVNVAAGGFCARGAQGARARRWIGFVAAVVTTSNSARAL